MKSTELDAIFDEGKEDVLGYLDLTKTVAVVPNKKINIDCPEWMVKGLDKEASHLGITRQSLIKVWLADKLKGA